MICMSSPGHLENFSIIHEATDDLCPVLTQENKSCLVLEPSMVHYSQEGSRINIGEDQILLENGNVQYQKNNLDDGISTCMIPAVADEWSSPPILDNANGDYKTSDSILFLEQESSALLNQNIIDQELLQKELQCSRPRPRSDNTGLLSPIDASDYACSLLQVSLLPNEDDNARTEELDSSTFSLEPFDPDIDKSLSVVLPLEDSYELDLLLLESSSTSFPSTDEKTGDDQHQTDIRLVDPEELESSALAADSSISKGLIGKRVSGSARGRNYKLQSSGNEEVQADKGERLCVKKQEHNAKERMRRMKLHATFLALGALLPDSSRSKKKKRKSAPFIIDRAVDYIPELEEEIEKLTLRKNEMLSKIKNKQSADHVNQNPHSQSDQLQDPSVSVNQIKHGEFIIQIWTQGDSAIFSNLLKKLEEEDGICIMSASTLQVSDHGVCYHLHIQMNVSLDEANRHASLREKVISWLISANFFNYHN